MLELFHYPFNAMGTECNIYLYEATSSRAEEIAQLAEAEVLRIESRYSRYDPHSLLSGINLVAQSGATTILDEETSALITHACACHKISGGLFDITSGVLRKVWDFTGDTLPEQSAIDALLPTVGMDKIVWEPPSITFTVAGMELDLGGVGKEYASDLAAEVCAGQGVTSGLVDLGGDIRIIGPHPDGRPWIIGIRNPNNPDAIMGCLELYEGALATSGDYERCLVIDGKRYSHIINPITGWPAQGLASVSVTGDSCATAGSISTIAMLKGVDGTQWLANTRAQYLWVDRDGNRGGPLTLIPPEEGE
jgi:thiamine biosynthesis lipoprotein